MTVIDAAELTRTRMLTRICLEDEDTVRVLEATGSAVTGLVRRGRMALVEPFLSVRDVPDRVRDLLDPDSVAKSIQIATSALTHPQHKSHAGAA